MPSRFARAAKATPAVIVFASLMLPNFGLAAANAGATFLDHSSAAPYSALRSIEIAGTPEKQALSFVPSLSEDLPIDGRITGALRDAYSGGQSMVSMPVADPSPEPQPYALLLAGVGLVAFLMRRRKKALSSTG